MLDDRMPSQEQVVRIARKYWPSVQDDCPVAHMKLDGKALVIMVEGPRIKVRELRCTKFDDDGMTYSRLIWIGYQWRGKHKLIVCDFSRQWEFVWASHPAAAAAWALGV